MNDWRWRPTQKWCRTTFSGWTGLTSTIPFLLFGHKNEGRSTGALHDQRRGNAFIAAKGPEKKLDGQVAIPAVRQQVGDSRVGSARTPRGGRTEGEVHRRGVVRIVRPDQTNLQVGIPLVHRAAMLIRAGSGSDRSKGPTFPPVTLRDDATWSVVSKVGASCTLL